MKINRIIRLGVLVVSFVMVTGMLRAESPQVTKAFPNSKWKAPTLDDENYLTWHEFVWPTEKELAWQNVRWHVELADAQEEAKELQRPILLWTMNGHPCGET